MKTLVLLLALLATPAYSWTAIGSNTRAEVAYEIPPNTGVGSTRMLWVRYNYTDGSHDTVLEQYDCVNVYKRLVAITSVSAQGQATRHPGDPIWLQVNPATINQLLINRACE